MSTRVNGWTLNNLTLCVVNCYKCSSEKSFSVQAIIHCSDYNGRRSVRSSLMGIKMVRVSVCLASRVVQHIRLFLDTPTQHPRSLSLPLTIRRHFEEEEDEEAGTTTATKKSLNQQLECSRGICLRRWLLSYKSRLFLYMLCWASVVDSRYVTLHWMLSYGGAKVLALASADLIP